MKRMSYLLLCAAIGFVTACSDDDSRQGAVLKKDELGMVVQRSSSTTNALLFEDGTLANPVSGLTNFNSRSIGSKLLLTYKTLDIVNGITNISVTSFAEANDSTFTPEPDPHIEDTVYSSHYTGTYFITNEDSTETYIGDIVLEFGAAPSEGTSIYSYAITPDGEEEIEGSGHFVIDAGEIVISDNEHSNAIVPLGTYGISAGYGWLYIWKVTEAGELYTYALKRDTTE